jgi:hypothetical protein
LLICLLVGLLVCLHDLVSVVSWPGLTHFELRSITGLKKNMFGQKSIVRFWDMHEDSGKQHPYFPTGYEFKTE